MIEQLPEGKSIGWMQAPPQWIFTHTVRFVGVVRIVIQDGEGFILIKKGKPLVYYFKHGRIELRGNAALDYFNSHPIIEFNLCKFTPEEFSQALKICNVDEVIPESAGRKDQITPLVTQEKGEEKIVEVQPGIKQPEQEPAPEQPKKPEPLAEEPVREKSPAYDTERPLVPQPVVLEDPDIKIIGQIKKLNGIVAISVFDKDRNILLMGDVDIEPLLKVARAMLATADKITPRLDWGSFVHMTLQIPEGNVIVAPYHENHLCILTTRTINIGHIRRILRDLQQD
jgi:predicted regulator of Ras-like GTPase activity (Roadblock/LC7/MglB family)